MLDYYVHAAAAADAAMPFLSLSREPTVDRPPTELPAFPDKMAALIWFGTEYLNLLAAFEAAEEAGTDRHLCELPRFMRTYFARRCGTTMLNGLFERSLAAAQRLAEPLQLAEAHSDLGFARYNAGRMTEAADAFEAAAPLVLRAGDLRAEAELAMRRGYLRWDEGYVEEPLDLFRLAGKLYADAGCPMGTAHATAYEAWALLQLGHREEAARLARTALELPHADGAWPPTLTALITLGVAIADDDPDEAAEHLHRALALAREDGHKHNEAWCLNCLGVALRRMGRHEEALARHEQAFALLDELFEEHWKIHFLGAYGETCRAGGPPGRGPAPSPSGPGTGPAAGSPPSGGAGSRGHRGGPRRDGSDGGGRTPGRGPGRPAGARAGGLTRKLPAPLPLAKAEPRSVSFAERGSVLL